MAAAKAKTATIPIVFTLGSDPVKFGVIASLNRPGGQYYRSVIAGLLAGREAGSAAARGAIRRRHFRHPCQSDERTSRSPGNGFPGGNPLSLGREPIVLNASIESQIDTAFTTLVEQRANSLVVSADPFFLSKRGQIIALAAHHALPAIYEWRTFAAAGGLRVTA